MTATKTGKQCYYNGPKDLYTISGKAGDFVRTGTPKGFYVSYKKVKVTKDPPERVPPQNLPKYDVDGNEVVWDFDMTLARWTELGGAVNREKKLLLWPKAAYPHLSIDHTEAPNRELTLGDAHYSTSQDDSARRTYKRTQNGWNYTPGGGTASPQTVRDADNAVKQVQDLLRKP